MSADFAAPPPLPRRLPAWRAWLQLFRPPNLFTVPGDPLVGMLILIGPLWIAAFPAFTSLCFYAAGLLMNDLADAEEDWRERPNRPLPSGAVSPRLVSWVIFLLFAAGTGPLLISGSMDVLTCGFGLLGAITTYNYWSKHVPVLGALNMGLCRTLSVMLGAYFTNPLVYARDWWPAVLLGLFIAAVTNLARYETRAGAPMFARVLPSISMLLWCAYIWYIGALRAGGEHIWPSPAVIGFLLVPLAGAAWLLVKLLRTPAPPLPPLIGAHIRLLLPMQASALAVALWLPEPTTKLWVAAAFLALWPIARLVSRWFYAS